MPPLLPMVTLLLAMVVSAMLVLATMARDLQMLNQRLRLMLVCITEDMAMVLVSDMLDLEDTVLAMAVSAMLVLATMARDLLTLNLRLRLMLVCIMVDMAMVLVSDMLDSDMDIPVLDMLDMEATVLAMAVSV